MRKIAAIVGLVSVFVLHGRAPAQAQPTVNVTQVADTPAATLLLPYFEVNLPKKQGAKAKGLTTLFSVNNASATAVLAHATVWSDLAVPVLQFNIYLTGYDLQTIDLRDVIAGHLPQTATAGGDPTDVISPKGNFSQDINFASCNSLMNTPEENLPPPDLSTQAVADLRAALTGKSSTALGGCAGLDHGDLIARGFVTLDTVNNCTQRLPTDAAYFTNDITFQNVLWGDYYLVDPSKKVGFGDTLVSVVASTTDPQTTTSGQYTFYGRLTAWDASDRRQPLSTTFAARYINNGKLFPGGTSLLVWRDPKVLQAAFTCGTSPAWYPLAQEGIAAFDEQETAENPVAPNAFPAAAQRVVVDGAALPVSFDSGWLFLNLNTTVAAAGSNPSEDAAAAQAWVSVLHTNKGRFTVGNRAVQLDSATSASHFTPTVP